MTTTVEISTNKNTVSQPKHTSIEEKIREVANSHQEIEVALIAKDGSSFLLLGKVWTADLSRMAAELAVKISKTSERWIHGGYRDCLTYPNDMRVIYQR